MPCSMSWPGTVSGVSGSIGSRVAMSSLTAEHRGLAVGGDDEDGE